LLLVLKLPNLLTDVRLAKIETLFVVEGQFLKPGMKVLDLRIDLSSVAAHDCPPVSFYRIAFRDRGWLRRLSVANGDTREAGMELALFSTEEDEPLEGSPGRLARFTTAGIIHRSDWEDDTGQ
jgi:hypothetical protein